MPPRQADIELGRFRGPLDTVLAAIEATSLTGAVLELEDGAGCAELDEFVDETTQGRPRDGGALSVPIESDNLARLRQIAARHPEPVIALHVHVRDHEGYLVEGWDIGDNVIFVSDRLPESARDAFRRALGDHLRPR